MAGKGGGAWKVAYADFVTAMMAFFLVMWIVGQGKEVRESVASYFRDPMNFKTKFNGTGMLPGGDVPMPRRVPARGPSRRNPSQGEEELLATIGDNPAAPIGNRPGMIVLREGKSTSVGAVIPFPEHSAELDDQGKKRLDRLLPLLVGKSNRVEIRGHSTRRPLPTDGPFKNDWELCYARCQATLAYLTEHDVSAERIRLSQSGPYEPESNEATAAAVTRNSRVEIYLLAEYIQSGSESLPGPAHESPSVHEVVHTGNDSHAAHHP